MVVGIGGGAVDIEKVVADIAADKVAVEIFGTAVGRGAHTAEAHTVAGSCAGSEIARWSWSSMTPRAVKS